MLILRTKDNRDWAKKNCLNSVQFLFHSHKICTKQLEYNTYVEEKKNYKDLEGKKEERERFAKYNGGAAGGVKGVKKLCLRRTLLRPTKKSPFGANNSVSLKI